MADPRKVIWSPTSRAHLKAILSYYNSRNQSTEYSQKLAKNIQKATAQLAQYPTLGKEYKESPKVRYLTLHPFQVYYEVLPEAIHILFLWDSRRNPEDLKQFLP